ncbi:hypothetical protein JXQ70_08875 [bacterium]|nr:hypothetical protein [bacterium]
MNCEQIWRFFLVILWLSVYCSVASAVDGPGSRTEPYRVPRTTESVRVDGLLDEVVWREALVIELPYEVNPGENIAAPVRTECLVTYDRTHLYIGFRAFDPDPIQIRSYYANRDSILPDDCVGVTLDTFNDERRAYDFFSNPYGVQFDAIDSNNGTDTSWDAIWDSAGQIFDWGYAVEMAIPFSQLRFQRENGGPQVWGIDADRRYPRQYSYILGAFPRDRANNCYLCQTIKISGFEGIQPGLNIEISPTLTGLRTDERELMPSGKMAAGENEVEAGLTTHWGVTPNLTLSGTINPDFSQVEADSLQLDINEPFALYYQEKRPFFTEGLDFFQMPVNVFYTRSIHKPDWGLRLSGKEGNHTIGLYFVRDETTNMIIPGNQNSYGISLDQEAFDTVVRYKYDLGLKYTFGALYTGREGDEYFNRVLGLDADFLFSENDRLTFQYLVSSTEYPEELNLQFGQADERYDDDMLFASYTHSHRKTVWWLNFEDAGQDFRADLGFVPMVDYRLYQSGGLYRWYATPDQWWSQINLGSEFEYVEDHASDPLNRKLSLWLNYAGKQQSAVYLNAITARESFNDEEFDLHDFTGTFSLKPWGNVYCAFNLRQGQRIDYYNTRLGQRILFYPEFNLKLGDHFSVLLKHSYEYMTVSEGRLYIAHISQGTVMFHFTQRAFIRAIFQYLDYERNPDLYTDPIAAKYQRLNNQLLFSYMINPRTVLFLGYSDGHLGNEDYDLTQQERTLFAKLGYAWMF